MLLGFTDQGVVERENTGNYRLRLLELVRREGMGMIEV